ncbi:hypothetical protein GCM10007424_07770 [Flavobacterium suaedae]|uniref:LPS export ABC transporter periplasmic protein LptC n=1 Tax=Flavobacterium suaedae TaxID=1767027 RepID=A0ABQ1JJU7_9FLAO|nr:hypothetical protein [Flavobacterium suaedae]GGB70279.1 hypothetical protein GCM10007424_07770 [Flavobacterium suaedae]
MKNYKYYFLVLVMIACSCNGNRPKEEELLQKGTVVIPKKQKSNIYKSDPLNASESKSTYKVSYELFEKQGSIESVNEYILNVKQLQFSEAQVFIYEYEFAKSDTLEIYQDSIIFNSTVIDKISSKSFKLNDRTVLVNKYFYSSVGENTLVSSNLYIVPSEGLVLQKTISQKSGSVEYNIGLELLQRQIQNDSVFFKFKKPSFDN